MQANWVVAAANPVLAIVSYADASKDLSKATGEIDQIGKVRGFSKADETSQLRAGQRSHRAQLNAALPAA